MKEKALLSCMVFDSKTAKLAIELDLEFKTEANRLIYNAMKELQKKGKLHDDSEHLVINPVDIAEELSREGNLEKIDGGLSYLVKLVTDWGKEGYYYITDKRTVHEEEKI